MPRRYSPRQIDSMMGRMVFYTKPKPNPLDHPWLGMPAWGVGQMMHYRDDHERTAQPVPGCVECEHDARLVDPAPKGKGAHDECYASGLHAATPAGRRMCRKLRASTP